MIAIILVCINGSGVNPNSIANGETGGHKAAIKQILPNTSNHFPGILTRNGLRVRMMNKINSSVITDSTNQPV